MGYLGLTPTTAQQNYLNIDDISGSFNGSTTSFALLTGGVAPSPFPVTNSCLISVGGVIQEPDDTGTSGFRISGSNIVFSSAPGTGEDFFGLILAGADYLNIGATFPVGTVGSPSITFDGDTNTGIYHPSADELSFVTGGSDRVRVDSNGRVGIGTSSPVFLTDILSGAANTGANVNNPSQLSVTGPNKSLTAGGATVFINSNSDLAIDTGGSIALSGRNTTSSTNSIVWGVIKGAKENATSTNTAGYLAFASANHSTGGLVEAMRIDSSQRVGIGTTSPAQKLHVLASQADAAISPAIQLTQQGSGAGTGTSLRIGYGSTDGAYSEIAGAYENVGTWLQFRTSPNNTTAATARMHITAAGNVGIGTTSPTETLHVNGGQVMFQETAAASNAVLRLKGSSTSHGGAIVAQSSSDGAAPLEFYSGGSQTMKIDSAGRLLVGTSTSMSAGAQAQYAKFQIIGSTASATGQGIISIGRGQAASGVISANNDVGYINFTDNAGNEFAQIGCLTDATTGTNDYPGRLTFSTTADGASSPTERMRITTNGMSKITNDGSYHDTTDNTHEITSNRTGNSVLHCTARNASFTAAVGAFGCWRTANSAYVLMAGYSGNGSSSPFNDQEFALRGDGNGYCDGAWTGGGADYAEYFEWFDNNPDEEDRRGISVVLDGDKIREAVAGEDPIGVISGNPSVVGDAAWNKWSGKYQRDEFGSYLLDAEGNRQLNPDYDPDVEYISREQRPEWDCVGLMGKLRIRKGQITGSRWIKMRDISDNVEEWLVR